MVPAPGLLTSCPLKFGGPAIQESCRPAHVRGELHSTTWARKVNPTPDRGSLIVLSGQFLLKARNRSACLNCACNVSVIGTKIRTSLKYGEDAVFALQCICVAHFLPELVMKGEAKPHPSMSLSAHRSESVTEPKCHCRCRWHRCRCR
jgi:hypothetical protein